MSDLMAGVHRTTIDKIGEAIEYAANGVTFVEKKAFVDYRDAVKQFEVSSAIEQDIMVRVLKVDVPVKPGPSVRIRLGKLAGKTFKPINPRSNKRGTHWEFEVQEVRT